MFISKFRENFKIALPAALVTLVIGAVVFKKSQDKFVLYL